MLPGLALQMPLDITRRYLCGQEAPLAGGLVDIFKSQDGAKKQTRLQSIQRGQEPWGISCRAEGKVGWFPHEA